MVYQETGHKGQYPDLLKSGSKDHFLLRQNMGMGQINSRYTFQWWDYDGVPENRFRNQRRNQDTVASILIFR